MKKDDLKDKKIEGQKKVKEDEIPTFVNKVSFVQKTEPTKTKNQGVKNEIVKQD